MTPSAPSPHAISAIAGTAATDIPKGATCCAEVGIGRWGFSSAICGNKASIEREGKAYCLTHDPVRIKEKREARNAKWRDELQAEDDARKAAKDKQAALEQDAARYRWLRARDFCIDASITSANADAAIDAACKE
jgi:hypothetical protein